MRLFATLSMAVLPLAAQAEDAPFYRLDPSALSCVLENLDTYSASMSDPIFIVMKDCPPSQEATLLSQLTNELPKPEFDEDGFDGFLALRQTDIACLEQLALPESSTAVRLYLDGCRAVAE